MPETSTERLARFVHALDPATLPGRVPEQATLCVLDVGPGWKADGSR